MIDPLIHWAGVAVEWIGIVGFAVWCVVAFLILAGTAILCLMSIPFAWNTLKANQAKRMRAREAVPETVPEMPFPGPVIEYGSMSDRLVAMSAKEEWKAWAYRQDVEAEIHNMIGDVRESDHG